MEDDPLVSTAPVRKKPFILFRVAQWTVFVLECFLLTMVLGEALKLNAPGAPVVPYASWTVALTIAVVLNLPSLFFRLPIPARILAYVAAIVTLGGAFNHMGDVQDAYDRTPEGAKIAAAQAEFDAEYDQQKREQAIEDAANAAEAQKEQEIEAIKGRAIRAREEALDRVEKIKGCLSWLGQFKPLVEDIESQLHNPHSFEHVETVPVGPDSDGMNIEMIFRAENGFGALRTASVRAKVNPDTCDLEDTGEFSVS